MSAGRMADRVGRRRVFALGLGLFTLASAGCGLAPTADVLVASRLLQGIVSALVSPSVLSMIGVLYTGAAISSLVPGLLMVTTGMGLTTTSLTTTVPASADLQRAGVVTGVLSTMQQVANSVDVAAVGLIFFDSLDSGYAAAMELALVALIGLLAAVAALSPLISEHGGTHDGEG